MLKPTLQLKIGQHLTMTPQLQQAIRLLQLSTLELQTEIQQTLESNPMLEESVEGESSQDDTDSTDNTENKEKESTLDNPVETKELQEELPQDTTWEDVYDSPSPYSAGPANDDNRNLLENQGGGEDSLQEHLLWQLRLTNMSETDRAIGIAIVDAIDDAGYLAEPLEDIHSNLVNELEIELDEVKAVLRLVQQFDPVGSGSRSPAECLLIQLRHLPKETPYLEPAVNIVTHYLDLLASRNFKQLMRRLKVNEDKLREVISLIQSLNPYPGTEFGSRAPEYIVPDVTVFKAQGSWQVELNADTAPKLRVNPLYASMVKRADQSKDNVYLKNNLQEARWFIKSLKSRNETLLKVATAIVRHQQGFFETGEEAMKPLVLKDIAEELGMHESTISRVTTHKYMHTSRGILEFKYFFSSHVGTADGGVRSATAIRAMIKSLIAQEEPSKPLSDNKIAATLVAKGINVARRTVAKYREAMNIPPSNERKRLS